LKVGKGWVPRENPLFPSEDKERHIVKASEYMYSLAPFYKLVKMLNMTLDDVIFPSMLKYLHTPPSLHMNIKKALLYYLIKLKPHHTKSIVQYSDGSCDTFEMYAVDNMLELAPNDFSSFDRE